MAIAIKFAGIELEGITGWQVSRKNKIADLTIPRRHGTLTPEVAFSDKMTIQVNGEVWRDTAADLRTYFDTIGALFFNAGKDRLEFLDDHRFVRALCSATAFPNFEAGRNPSRRAAFSAEFTCADPFWYAATESSDLRTDPVGYSVTNAGKVRTPVRWEIRPTGGHGTDIKITNSTTGLFMHFRGKVNDNTTLIVDAARYSCDNGGQNGLNLFDGDFFLLEPGVNNITLDTFKTLEFTSGPPVVVNCSLYWSERFIH